MTTKKGAIKSILLHQVQFSITSPSLSATMTTYDSTYCHHNWLNYKNVCLIMNGHYVFTDVLEKKEVYWGGVIGCV